MPTALLPDKMGLNEEDKLSRIAALRPASPGARDRGTIPRENREDLAELLRGECRVNSLGRLLAVRESYPEPRAFRPTLQAIRRLLVQGAEEGCDPERWLFLDTETTGLSGGTGTYAFLVGLAWWEAGGFTVEQLFMRDHSEEPSLLLEISRALENRPILVTFNGKSFDWPLLETRFRMNRIVMSGSPRLHIDLLHPARQLWRYRFPSVALVELERNVLSLERGFDIPSESIPGRYFDFLRGGPAEPIAEVFHHNRMDLRGLAALSVHMTGLLEQPEYSFSEPAELYGMSRLLDRRGESELAGVVCDRALAAGLDEAAGRSARREAALRARRSGDFERAARLWDELLGSTHEGLEAHERLAIYHEHRTRDHGRAAALTRDALVILREAFNSGRLPPQAYRRWHARFQHRLDRLARKISGIP